MLDQTSPSARQHPDFTPTYQLLQRTIDCSDSFIAYCEVIREQAQATDFIIRLANKAVYDLVGKPAEQVLGAPMTQLFPGIKAAGLLSRYIEVVETRQEQKFEFSSTTNDQNIWYLVTAKPLDEGLVVSFVDITAQKKAEQQCQQQADEFRQILDNALTAIAHFTAVRDEQGQVIDFIYKSFNKSSESITGRKASEVVNRRMLELFPGVRTSGIFDKWVNLMESGGSVRFQNRYSYDGFDFWYDTQAVKWGDGFIQSYIDITPIKQVELAYQQQNDFLTLLLNTSPGGIIAYKAIREPTTTLEKLGPIRDFQTIFFNSAYEEILEAEAKMIQNHTFRERFNDESYDDLLAFYARLVETGQSIRREHYYTHLDKWLDVAGAKLEDGFLLIVNDITARKQAEQERQRQAEALEQANRLLARSNENLQQFAYIASHDLQEPLRKIQSFGSILQERYAATLGEQGADMIDRMKSASNRMSILIKDLLNYSRLTTLPPSFRPQPLSPIVESVLTTLDMVVKEKKATIDLGDLGTVLGDTTQLAQLFQNLLTNALKFTRLDELGAPIPPHILIRSQRVDPAHLPADYQPVDAQTNYRLIQVSDNGIGFDQQQAERIFGAFQRLNSRSQYPGTGIGLAIVRKVVDNHRGYIVAHSKPDEGSTFSVYLPAGD